MARCPGRHRIPAFVEVGSVEWRRCRSSWWGRFYACVWLRRRYGTRRSPTA